MHAQMVFCSKITHTFSHKLNQRMKTWNVTLTILPGVASSNTHKETHSDSQTNTQSLEGKSLGRICQCLPKPGQLLSVGELIDAMGDICHTRITFMPSCQLSPICSSENHCVGTRQDKTRQNQLPHWMSSLRKPRPSGHRAAVSQRAAGLLRRLQ